MVEVNLNNPANLERELVEKFAKLHAEVDQSAALLSEKKKLLADVESQLMELLDDEGKKASARFEGVGHVTCVDPTPYASILEGEEQKLFEHLRKIGREDLIKTSVHSMSLSVLVRERLKSGEEIPPGTTYFMKRRLLFTPHNKR